MRGKFEMMRKAWIFVVYLASFLLHISTGEKAILLERPKRGLEGLQSWQWSASKREGSAGWVEPSSTKTSYSVCDVDGNQPSNWLRSDGIQPYNVRRVDITINYTVATRCADIAEPSVRQNCKEHFDVYGYQATDNESSNESYSNPTNGHYSKIETISWSSNFSNQSKWKIATMSLSIKEGTSQVFIGIHDQGACFVLNSFLVTYNICPKQTLPGSLIYLPQAMAPTNESEIVRVEGRCADNSELASPDLDATCLTSGEWMRPDDGKEVCRCKPGYEINITKCEACQLGHFKDNPGNTKCTKCPVNSKTTETDRTYCKCRREFFRAPWEKISDNCTGRADEFQNPKPEVFRKRYFF